MVRLAWVVTALAMAGCSAYRHETVVRETTYAAGDMGEVVVDLQREIDQLEQDLTECRLSVIDPAP